MDLFRFGPIPGHDRMSGIDSLKDADLDIGDMSVFLREQSFCNTCTAVSHLSLIHI